MYPFQILNENQQPADILDVQNEIPKYHSGELVYFVRLDVPAQSKPIDRCFLLGKITTDNPIESLYSFMTGNYMKQVFAGSSWPDSTVLQYLM